MKEKQRDYIEDYKKISNVKAGVEAYFIAAVSALTAITTILIFLKILIFHEKESFLDYFAIYNMFSFEKSLNLLHYNLSMFLNNLKYFGYCD
jgi:succinate dehydrogenase hydrophobic anchor subunit